MPGSGGANWHALLTPQTSACVFPAPAQGGGYPGRKRLAVGF